MPTFLIRIRWTSISLLALTTAAQTPRADVLAKLSAAAIERTHHSVRYVSDYVRIPYRGGDVPADTGVCTDEVIRSYRALGIDLQKEVHEDMVRDFAAYPHWRQRYLDANIDHRRVPNLMVFFARHGTTLPISINPHAYAPGYCGLEPGRRHHSHWHCGRPKRPQWKLHDRAQHWPRAADGRCFIRLGVIGHYRYYGPKS